MTALKSTRPTRVLVIDDERPTARLIEYILQKVGYEVAKVGTGEAGLAMAREFRPDVVLLDLNLPGISGKEVLEEIRGDSSFGHPVIIVLTAGSFETVGDSLRAAGADSHFTKPIAPTTLLQKLEALGVPPLSSRIAEGVA